MPRCLSLKAMKCHFKCGLKLRIHMSLAQRPSLAPQSTPGALMNFKLICCTVNQTFHPYFFYETGFKIYQCCVNKNHLIHVFVSLFNMHLYVEQRNKEVYFSTNKLNCVFCYQYFWLGVYSERT